MSLITLKNIQKTYCTDEVATPVLHDLSLTVQSGEFLAITGPSGAGKSTLLHILGMLDKQTGGQYFFEDKAVDDYDESAIARLRNEKLGFVFQAFNLLPRTSVLENVKLPLAYSHIPMHEWDTRALRAIKSVGLEHRIDHEPSQLSGGEKQRVAIARALINNPAVLFADEPTGNLDTGSGAAVLEILKQLNAEGHTVIIITHDHSIAQQTRRIVRIVDGKIHSDERTINNG
jgi:putative ABC transport system ATP-binding protein